MAPDASSPLTDADSARGWLPSSKGLGKEVAAPVLDWNNRTGRIWLIVCAVIAVAFVVVLLLLFGGGSGSGTGGIGGY